MKIGIWTMILLSCSACADDWDIFQYTYLHHRTSASVDSPLDGDEFYENGYRMYVAWSQYKDAEEGRKDFAKSYVKHHAKATWQAHRKRKRVKLTKREAERYGELIGEGEHLYTAVSDGLKKGTQYQRLCKFTIRLQTGGVPYCIADKEVEKLIDEKADAYEARLKKLYENQGGGKVSTLWDKIFSGFYRAQSQ